MSTFGHRESESCPISGCFRKFDNNRYYDRQKALVRHLYLVHPMPMEVADRGFGEGKERWRQFWQEKPVK